MVTLILWLLSVKEKMDVKPYLIPFEEDWMKIYSFSIRDCSLLTGKMCWNSAENQSRYFFLLLYPSPPLRYLRRVGKGDILKKVGD